MGSSAPISQKVQPNLLGSKGSEARPLWLSLMHRCLNLPKPQFSHLENGDFKKGTDRWASHGAWHTESTRSVGAAVGSCQSNS